jgi:hypothetical protein
MGLIDLAERAVLPDWLIRIGIRRLLARRFRLVTGEDVAQQAASLRESICQLRQSRTHYARILEAWLVKCG